MKHKFKSHLVIPDGQVKHGVDIKHWHYVGLYAAAKKPDVIINLGDFADMSSLSSYDRGKKAFEGRRYLKDVRAVREAMGLFMSPVRDEMVKSNWNPRLVFLTGNHEDRITRMVEDNPELDGFMSIQNLGYEEHGWEMQDFLNPIEIDGILYSHFFPRGANGRITQTRKGSPSASTQVKREMMSCTAGHAQGLDISTVLAGNDRIFRGVIAGSCYTHDEKYMSPQGNTYFRGILLKHQVDDGQYLLCEVSLDFLKHKYKEVPLPDVKSTLDSVKVPLIEYDDSFVCPKCGSSALTKRGVYETKKETKQRYICDMGHWSSK